MSIIVILGMPFCQREKINIVDVRIGYSESIVVSQEYIPPFGIKTNYKCPQYYWEYQKEVGTEYKRKNKDAFKYSTEKDFSFIVVVIIVIILFIAIEKYFKVFLLGLFVFLCTPSGSNAQTPTCDQILIAALKNPPAELADSINPGKIARMILNNEADEIHYGQKIRILHEYIVPITTREAYSVPAYSYVFDRKTYKWKRNPQKDYIFTETESVWLPFLETIAILLTLFLRIFLCSHGEKNITTTSWLVCIFISNLSLFLMFDKGALEAMILNTVFQSFFIYLIFLFSGWRKKEITM